MSFAKAKTMQKSLALLTRGFESSSGKTPEFLAFARTFKRELTDALRSAVNAENVTFNVGHFYVSGFFTVNGQAWYFATGDVRGMTQSYGLLLRTARDYRDFTGGANNNIPMRDDMIEKVARIVDRAPTMHFLLEVFDSRNTSQSEPLEAKDWYNAEKIASKRSLGNQWPVVLWLRGENKFIGFEKGEPVTWSTCLSHKV